MCPIKLLRFSTLSLLWIRLSFVPLFWCHCNWSCAGISQSLRRQNAKVVSRVVHVQAAKSSSSRQWVESWYQMWWRAVISAAVRRQLRRTTSGWLSFSCIFAVDSLQFAVNGVICIIVVISYDYNGLIVFSLNFYWNVWLQKITSSVMEYL